MTNEQIIAAIGVALQGLTEALINKDAKNSLKLAGKTLAEIKEEVLSGVDLTSVVLKTDNLGQYNVEIAFADEEVPTTYQLGGLLSILRSRINSNQTDIENFIAAKATGEEVITGTDNAKYTTALAVKAAIDAAIAALVDGAPTALDTLKELADKLSEEGDALAAIVQSLGDKLGKTETAADSSKFAGKTVAERTASSAEVIDGTDGEKWVTSAGIKALLGDLNDKHGLFKVLDMTVGSGKEAMASAGPAAVYNVGVVHGRVRGNQVGLTGGPQGNSYGVLTIYGQSAGPLPSVGAHPGFATSGIRREFRNANGTRWQTVTVTGSGTEGDPFVYSWGTWNVQAELTSTVAAASQVVVGSGTPTPNIYSDDPAAVAAVLNNQIGFGVFAVSLVESGASAANSQYNWPGIEQAVPNVAARTGRMEVWWSGTILFRRIVLGGLIATQHAYNVGNGGVFSAWERIGNGVADDANKLGGQLPSYYASQATVDSMFENLTDSINAATDLVNDITRVTYRMTPASFGQQGGNGGVLWGYERNDRGALSPNNIFRGNSEVTELTWLTVDNKFSLWVQGEYPNLELVEFTIGGITANGVPVINAADGETSITVAAPDVSGLPTTGEAVKVVVRVKIPVQ